MNLTAKQLKRIALKLGYRGKEGSRHLLIYNESGLMATVPRGRIKPGTLAAILKQMGISRGAMGKLL